MSSNRTNDGLDASGTTDAYSQGGGRGNTTYRSNDGLDASGTTDAYNSRSGGGGSSNRTNDGLDASGTSDAYGDQGRSGGNYRTNDGLDTSDTSDSYGGGSDRRRANEARDTSGGTSGGLGYDDTIGSNRRTGGAQRGGDQETSQHTSGGLGENDTYGDQEDTGGADTGYDHNYGMGTGRTVTQEKGGPLPTEPGRSDIHRNSDDFDPRPGEDELQYEPAPPKSKPQPTYNNRGDDDYDNNTRGGNDYGYDSNQGQGTGCSNVYDDDINRGGSGYDNSSSGRGGDRGGNDYDYDDGQGTGTGTGSKNKDSTTGKLMEKAGGLFKNEGLREKGEEKRRQAGGGSEY